MNARFRAALCALGLTLLLGTAAAAVPPLLDPVSHPKFVNPLPIPARIDATAGQHFEMQMNETEQWLGLVDGTGAPLTTTVWGYGPAGGAVSYPGPTFVTYRDTQITVDWHNNLPPYNSNFPDGPGAHLLPVDPTLHMAHPPAGGIPTVTHLHGGHTESASDGLPEAWYTQAYAETGPQFVKQTYVYDNDQAAGTLWYHDHALGITRLNVYAGLAGFYLLRDDLETHLTGSGVLPGGPYEIEIVFQDRMFEATGALFYPSEDPEIEPGFPPLPDVPSAIAEFFGDFIMVNGAAWPRLEVEPRKYRFRFLNGSDSRFYVIELQQPMIGTPETFQQIGTDNGLLPKPVVLDRLLFAPGERADVVVDFSGYPDGTEIVVKNFGPDDPFKGFNPDGTLSDGDGGIQPPADPATTGQLMKFVVNQPLDGSVPDALVREGTRLRPNIKKLKQTGATRSLVLFEGLDEYGRLQPLLGTLGEGSLAWFEPITENPMLDDVEVWEVYNATEDAHPVHLHLVAFQILDRRSFFGTVEEKPQPQHDGSFGVGGILTVTGLADDKRKAEKNEQGWKDTAVMYPGEVTRVIAKFDRTGRYVWHCHILSHEDHEMMRPYEVLAPAARQAGMEVAVAADRPVTLQVRGTELSLDVSRTVAAELDVFDVSGRRIRMLRNEPLAPGVHRVGWDGRNEAGRPVAAGVYFFRLRTPDDVMTAKTLIVR